VRGFEDVLLNVTLDGAPQAGELYHHQGRLQLEPEFIRSIQLDAGAGAATAGAGALTGALAVTTKDAFDLLEARPRAGRPSTRATASFNGEDSLEGRRLRLRQAHRPGRRSSPATPARAATDYEDGRGNLVTPTAFEHARDPTPSSARFGATKPPRLRARARHRHLLRAPELRELHRHLHPLRSRPRPPHPHLQPPLQSHRRPRRLTRHPLLDRPATFLNRRNTTGALYGKGDFTSAGLDLRNTSKWSNHAATYGVEYRADDAFGRQQATPPAFWGFSWQSASRSSASTHRTTGTSPTRVRLSGGLRFDDYQHDVDAGVGAGVSNDDRGFSPNAGIEWEPPRSHARTAYAQSFRGITIREAFFSGLYVHQGNLEARAGRQPRIRPRLREERLLRPRHALPPDHRELHQRRLRRHARLGLLAQRTGDAQVEGYEAEFGRRWHDVSLSLGVWEADNTFNGRALNDGDLGLGTRIGRTWLARVDWHSPPARRTQPPRSPRRVRGELHLRHRPRQARLRHRRPPRNWRPLGDRRHTLSLSVNNAFDEFYYDHATYSYHAGTGKYIGFPAKGREFVLSAAYKF
jgi:hemoglobin/transferrin/lactoferrin receptor protein